MAPQFTALLLSALGACLGLTTAQAGIGDLPAAGQCNLATLSPRANWGAFWSSLTGFGVTLSLALVGLASIDYLAQRWLHERSLRMTREEIREEALREEGDQNLKSRRLGMQRQLSNGRATESSER